MSKDLPACVPPSRSSMKRNASITGLGISDFNIHASTGLTARTDARQPRRSIMNERLFLGTAKTAADDQKSAIRTWP